MPHHARTHSENLSRVCYFCFNKVINNGKKITIKNQDEVSKIDPGFVYGSNNRPNVLCSSCYLKMKNGVDIKIFNYAKINIREKRGLVKCDCAICEVARSNVLNKISSEILEFSIKHQSIGRPSSSSDRENSEKPSTVKICLTCNGKVGKGIRHVCTKAKKVQNGLQLLDGVRQQVAASIIEQEQSSTETQTITLNRGRGAGLSVTTVKRKREEDNRPVITANVLKDIQLNCNMTMNGVKKLCQSLRTVDKNIITPNAITTLQEETHELDSFFSMEILNNVEVTHYSENGYPFVFCSDLPGLVSYLAHKRGLGDDFHVKIGIDGGQKSLKVSLLRVFCASLLSVLDISKNNESCLLLKHFV